MEKMSSLKVLISKTPLYLLGLLCAFPLMVFHVQSKVVIIWALVSLFVMIKQSKDKFIKENLKLYFYNISWVLWLIITMIYSSDLLGGLKELERILSILVIPLIVFFFSKKITDHQRFVLFLIFTIAILCFTIYSYVYIVNYFEVHYYSLYLKGKEFDLLHYIKFHLKVSKLYLYNDGTDYGFKLFYHKSYYSLSLLFSICFLIYNCFQKPKYKFYFISITLVFMMMMIVHISKIHILLFILFAILASVFYLMKIDLSKLKYKGIFTTLFMVLVAVGYYGVMKNANDLGNSFMSRKNINECSVALIKEKPLQGYGFGSVKQIMKKCYGEKFKNDSHNSFLQNQNTHNYYLYVYLSGGIIGLFLFLLMVYKNINIALCNNDFLYLFFLIGFFVTILFENSLFRIYGILYFTIFNSIFLQKYLRTA